jgi:putative ABC transport system permease protein
MKIPLIYNWRSLMGRPISTAFTALGIGLVVAVFIGMLALANGFAAAMITTGSTQNALVLRKGADSEMASGIDRASSDVIASDPHVARGADGVPLVSKEVYVVIPFGRIQDTTQLANVVLRGISDKVWDVREHLVLTAGQRPVVGRNEVCVGQKLIGRFPNMGVGDAITIGGRPWTVVCQFSAGGSSFESEVWGMNEQVMPILRGEVFQSITFRLADPAGFEEAKRALEADRRVQVDVHRELDFYTQQSEMLGNLLRFLAVMITSIMSVGAVFGAVNTMYAAVASRSSEIAVLLTLGFRPFNIMMSFLAESALIALVGGVLGCLMALPVNGIVTSTTNWASFSEIAFSFRITPGLLLAGICFSLVMGLIGGFFPARRAAKMLVVQGIR